MRLEDVNTWQEYEEYVRSLGPEEAAIVDKCTRVAEAVITAMNELKDIHMGMLTYDLDEMPEDHEVEIEDYEDEDEELEAEHEQEHEQALAVV